MSTFQNLISTQCTLWPNDCPGTLALRLVRYFLLQQFQCNSEKKKQK